MPRTPRGLASVHQVRELRQQRKFVRPSAKHWGVVVFGLLGVLGVHFTCAQRGLDARKRSMLARREPLAATFGPRWTDLRTVVTDTAVRLARDPWPGDDVSGTLSGRPWRSEPAVFLRLGSNEATGERAVLEASKLSPRDAFLACLRGPALPTGGDRLARFHRVQESFEVTRLLEAGWVDDVTAAGDELRLKVFEEQLAAATPKALERAAALVEGARLVIVVVDEVAPEHAAARGAVEDVQRTSHGLRVALVDRPTKVQLARIRVEPDVTLVPGGEGRVTDEEARAAIDRQAVGCSAARQFDATVDRLAAAR